MFENSNYMNMGHKNRQSHAAARALRAPASLCLWRSVSGQQVLEYAVLITSIAIALTVIFTYSKRGLQAVIKSSADQIAPQEDFEPHAGSVVTKQESRTDSLSNTTGYVRKDTGENKYLTMQTVTLDTGWSNATTETY